MKNSAFFSFFSFFSAIYNENVIERMIYDISENIIPLKGGIHLSLEIDFENKEGYVHAPVTGTFTKESALAMFEKLLIYCTVTNTMKILVDCRGMGADINIEELFAFSQKSDGLQSDYGEKGMIHEMRTAYVFDPEKHDLNHINKGVFNPEKTDFILTLDHEEAVNWLASQ